MEWPDKIVSVFKANEITSISFVPDSVIDKILKIAEKDPYFDLTTLAREEEAIGIITGEYLGGRQYVCPNQPSPLLYGPYQLLSVGGDASQARGDDLVFVGRGCFHHAQQCFSPVR